MCTSMELTLRSVGDYNQAILRFNCSNFEHNHKKKKPLQDHVIQGHFKKMYTWDIELFKMEMLDSKFLFS